MVVIRWRPETIHLVQVIIRYHSLMIMGKELEEIAEEGSKEDLIRIDAENKFIGANESIPTINMVNTK